MRSQVRLHALFGHGGLVLALLATAIVTARADSAAGRTEFARPPSRRTASDSPDPLQHGRPAIHLPYRAFSPTSYWNTPLPRDAPIDPASKQLISFLRRANRPKFLWLSVDLGAHPAGWGMPIYWAGPSDRTYRVRNNCPWRMPPELGKVRIPIGARAAANSDSPMTVYDLGGGLVYGLWRARYDPPSRAWSACGGTVYALRSNGLAGDVPQSDDERNFGHRGIPPPVAAVRLDEVQLGVVAHVLKIGIDEACGHVFPMDGDEGCTNNSVIPEGARLRIKPSVHLERLGLSPAALVVARALQTYGSVVGDQSGGPISLKLEDTMAEGRGNLWRGLLGPRSLSRIPLRDFQVIRLGYGA